MVIRLSLEKDRKFFFLLMVICCFEAILCRSLDNAFGPWQQWTGCSVSCGEGEQTRRRDCLHPPHQFERGMQTMHSDIGCRGNKSMVIRRHCNMEPCSFFDTEFDPSSLSSSSSYPLMDPAEIIYHRYRNAENAAAVMEGYGSMSTYDEGCSVVNQEIICNNSTSDHHVRLRRAIRLSLGEMIYSNWTPWTTCSCITSTNTRYRFCIVGKRQCGRAKGRFPTKETSSCQCGDTPASKGSKRKNRLSRKYPSERSDPYTLWSNWGRCPCERDAFRSRNRLCRPGNEIACLERKQQTGLGIVQLKRCRPHRGCQGSGPMTDLLAQRERLPERLPEHSPPPNPNHGRQVIPRPASNPSSRFTQPERPPPIPSEPEYVMPNRVGERFEEEPQESSDRLDRYGADESRRPGVQVTVAPPPRPMPVEPVLSWSSWSEWETCSRTCGTENTFRWRECQDDHGQLVAGCEGEYMGSRQCINGPCPVEIVPTTSRPEMITEDPSICRAYNSDTTGIGPRRRETITTEDERSIAECPAYYGLAYEPPTQPPRPPPPPAAEVARNVFNWGRRFFG